MTNVWEMPIVKNDKENLVGHKIVCVTIAIEGGVCGPVTVLSAAADFSLHLISLLLKYWCAC